MSLRGHATIDLKSGVRLKVYELNGRGFVAMSDAGDVSDVKKAAIVAKHCTDDFAEHSVEEVLDDAPVADLLKIMAKVLEISAAEEDDPKDSGTGPVAVSS